MGIDDSALLTVVDINASKTGIAASAASVVDSLVVASVIRPSM